MTYGLRQKIPRSMDADELHNLWLKTGLTRKAMAAAIDTHYSTFQRMLIGDLLVSERVAQAARDFVARIDNWETKP